MVSESAATRQALRLSILVSDSNGASDVAQEEIVKALQKYAVNDEHCVRIVDAWMKSEKYRPVPSDIRKMAELVSAMDHSKPDRACKACYGTGWEQVFTLHTYERTPGGGQYQRREIIPTKEQADMLKQTVDGVKQIVYDNVQRCTRCGYGKQLAVEEFDRKEKAANEKTKTSEEREGKLEPCRSTLQRIFSKEF